MWIVLQDSEIKPSTFRRLPCLFPRTSDFNLTYTLQCQSSGCCRDFSPTVNRLPSVEGVTQELLFELQQKSPNLLTGINNDNLLAYLTLISGVQPRVSTYTNNNCPYKYFPFPGLPNLSDSVIGCCSHYICYHRKFVSKNVKRQNKFVIIQTYFCDCTDTRLLQLNRV